MRRGLITGKGCCSVYRSLPAGCRTGPLETSLMTHESQGTKGLLDGIFPVETATLTAVMVYYLFKEHWEHLIGYVDSLFFGVFVLLSGMILWHFGQETSSTTKERNYG